MEKKLRLRTSLWDAASSSILQMLSQKAQEPGMNTRGPLSLSLTSDAMGYTLPPVLANWTTKESFAGLDQRSHCGLPAASKDTTKSE